jgi:hypothetical protein
MYYLLYIYSQSLKAMLETEVTNKDSLRLYGKLGFAREEVTNNNNVYNFYINVICCGVVYFLFIFNVDRFYVDIFTPIYLHVVHMRVCSDWYATI